MAVMYSCQIKMKSYCIREATGPTVRGSADFAREFKDLSLAGQEMFCVVTLDQKNKTIDRHVVSVGTLTASLVHPREVFRPALIEGAACVAFVHNHPSGDVTPSQEDRTITARLLRAAEILGLRVLDHVIVGRDGKWFSFLDEGILK